ncbi:MAG: hypothetical protein BGO26_06770 [Actinobacteria bacterium 69-20]|nr:hypothetical protein [Actinomycetota bacterium]OJV28137.1 MAG: hypothetical protein BGO26_06770 [Actinobacteria bacterium 69-20]
MSQTSAALIAAFADNDLYERIVALAATVGVTPDQVAQARWQMVIAAANDSGTDTIASVYDYAMETRAQAVAALPPAPGINPGAVTDAHILHALGAVFPPTP